MYCGFREQTVRYPCRCQACYQREINSCRCHQTCYSYSNGYGQQGEKKEVTTEQTQPTQSTLPTQSTQPTEQPKKVKKSKWPYWKCVNCSDGKVRFLKTNVCPIPRKGYSLQREPKFEPYVEPYVYEKPTKQPPPNKKDENSTEQKKTEKDSKKKSKKSNDEKSDGKKKRDKKRKIKVICCCSHQAANHRPVCSCQNAHTSSAAVQCRYQRSVTENMCCQCKQQAKLAKLNKKKTSYDCIRQYTESGETRMVCKKKKKPCVNTEEYALLFEDETNNPYSGPTPTQIIIVADPKCNDSPAIQLSPIDPFTPVPVCDCKSKQHENEEPLSRESENTRTSVDAGNKSARQSLEDSKKSVDSTPRSSVEKDKKKKKK